MKMKLLKDLRRRLPWLNAYTVVAAIFFVVTFVTGDSSLYHRFTYDRKIRRIEADIERYRSELEVSRRQLERLRTPRRNDIERLAREDYRMKAPNEDLFVFSEE
ncbi:MAG: septum formation initiator family protein [Tannerellaceae bacterium]|jgi:cell division protein FtsB|nr:septum formation initiator family protein [Tannerellaceae bacterium]